MVGILALLAVAAVVGFDNAHSVLMRAGDRGGVLYIGALIVGAIHVLASGSVYWLLSWIGATPAFIAGCVTIVICSAVFRHMMARRGVR